MMKKTIPVSAKELNAATQISSSIQTKKDRPQLRDTSRRSSKLSSKKNPVPLNDASLLLHDAVGSDAVSDSLEMIQADRGLKELIAKQKEAEAGKDSDIGRTNRSFSGPPSHSLQLNIDYGDVQYSHSMPPSPQQFHLDDNALSPSKANYSDRVRTINHTNSAVREIIQNIDILSIDELENLTSITNSKLAERKGGSNAFLSVAGPNSQIAYFLDEYHVDRQLSLSTMSSITDDESPPRNRRQYIMTLNPSVEDLDPEIEQLSKPASEEQAQHCPEGMTLNRDGAFPPMQYFTASMHSPLHIHDSAREAAFAASSVTKVRGKKSREEYSPPSIASTSNEQLDSVAWSAVNSNNSSSSSRKLPGSATTAFENRSVSSSVSSLSNNSSVVNNYQSTHSNSGNAPAWKPAGLTSNQATTSINRRSPTNPHKRMVSPAVSSETTKIRQRNSFGTLSTSNVQSSNLVSGSHRQGSSSASRAIKK